MQEAEKSEILLLILLAELCALFTASLLLAQPCAEGLSRCCGKLLFMELEVCYSWKVVEGSSGVQMSTALPSGFG